MRLPSFGGLLAILNLLSPSNSLPLNVRKTVMDTCPSKVSFFPHRSFSARFFTLPSDSPRAENRPPQRVNSIQRLAWGLILLSITSPALWGQEAASPSSPTSIDAVPAANEEVARVMREFTGRGQLSDGTKPTSPEKALGMFRMAEGLQMESVASEPKVAQPLFLSFDHRGRMWVVQYRQYPFPAGLKVVRYDQHLRAIFDRVPPPPPHHTPGRDRITVFEDLDGDGMYESHRDVIDGLNIATSVVADLDAIWVLNPPYLLRYPDQDGNAVPDGDPEVHLSGFGLEDTHSVANSLCWGPDGWLYGANGSTTTGNVRARRGEPVAFQGQCIWRYHPQSETFEIYAEGGGNTFSLEIDSVGRVFSGTNHGNTRGMYYPQGSYGEKNWGKHGPLTNPHAFGFFRHMRFEGDGDRFAQTFTIYEADALPQAYRGNIVAANSLHNRVWASSLLRDSSTYRTVDLPPVAETSDRWFRPVDVKVGPDGAVYLADWYDSRLSHVDPRDDWHKESGRIYRVAPDQSVAAAKDPEPSKQAFDWLGKQTRFDLTAATDQQLLELLRHPNKFFRHTSVRVLVARKSPTLISELLKIVTTSGDGRALEALWVLARTDQLDESLALKLFQHENPHVRRWTVRFLGDRRYVTAGEATGLSNLARSESDIQVRTQLASSAKRIQAFAALPIVKELLQHDADSTDLHQPLLLWWAIEEQCQVDREAVLDLFRDQALWQRPVVREVILKRLTQRFAASGIAEDWDTCAELLAIAPDTASRRLLVAGFREALAGRTLAPFPEKLSLALKEYQAEAQESDLPLRVRSADKGAIDEALKLVANSQTDTPTRIELIETLGQVQAAGAEKTLLRVLSESASPSLQRVALLALSVYDQPVIGTTICSSLHSTLPPEHDLQYTAFKVLASRPLWAGQLLNEVEQWRIKREAIPMDIVQQMRFHEDPGLQQRLQKIWGSTRGSPETLLQELTELRKVLGSGQGDLDSGRALFTKKCGVCHNLFGEGGQTGPNLTGYERDNLQFILPAIVDPSLAIREEFTSYRVLTNDGRVLTGLLENQTPQTVTLRGVDNKTMLVNRDDIESLQAQSQSLMPEGLLRDLSDQEKRDLIAYVTTRAPLGK